MSRATGLVSVWVLLAVVGNSNRLADAYNISNNLPNILYELLAGGLLSAALVPLFVERADAGDEEGVRALVAVAFLGLGLLTLVAIASVPVLSWFFSRGVPEEGYEGALRSLMAWLLPQIFFYGAVTVLSALHNARGRFALPAFAPAVNNVVVVAGLALAAGTISAGAAGGDALAGAVAAPLALPLLGGVTTLGVLASAAVLLLGLRGAPVLWGPVRLRHPVVGRLARASGWTFGYVAANQVTTLAIIVIANRDGPGAASSYLNAYRFFIVPHGILAVSLLTVVLPGFSRLVQQGRSDELRRRWVQGYRVTALLVVPAAGALWLLSEVALRLATTGRDAADIAGVLEMLALGLPAFSLFLYSLRAFYAAGDTRTPFRLNVLENAVQLSLSLPLGLAFGAPGLAGAHTIGYLVAAVAAYRLAARRLGGVGGTVLDPVARTVAAGVGATAAAGAVLLVIGGPMADRSALGALAVVALGATALVAVYAALVRLLGLGADLAPLTRRWARR